jgi:hypothetical protein
LIQTVILMQIAILMQTTILMHTAILFWNLNWTYFKLPGYVLLRDFNQDTLIIAYFEFYRYCFRSVVWLNV